MGNPRSANFWGVVAIVLPLVIIWHIVPITSRSVINHGLNTHKQVSEQVSDVDKILIAIEKIDPSVPLNEREERLVSIRKDIIKLLKADKVAVAATPCATAAEERRNSRYTCYCQHCRTSHIKITREENGNRFSIDDLQYLCEKNKRCGKHGSNRNNSSRSSRHRH